VLIRSVTWATLLSVLILFITFQNIKKLLKLAYSKSNVSMMVHRVGNTLMLDEFDIHRYLLRQQDNDWQWLRRFFLETVLQKMGENAQVNILPRFF
jgi:hypothetical protein